MHITFNYAMIGRHDINNHFPFAQNFFRKVYKDGRYNEWFDKMVDAKIFRPQLNVKGTSTYWKGHSIHYTLNPALITDNFIEAELEMDVDDQKISIMEEDWDATFIKEEFYSLKIDKTKLLAESKKIVDAINSADLILNEDVQELKFEVHNCINGYRGYTTKEQCLKDVSKHFGNSLIKDGDKFTIDTVDSYIADKKKSRWFKYNSTIEKLSNKIFYANRNDTNNRLDHNLTSLPKVLLNIIKVDNELVEIDLANSQFKILAHIMAEDKEFVQTPDFILYQEMVSKGLLYDCIKDHFNISKQEAKLMVMQLSFSSHKNNTPEKAKLKQLFPSVVKYIDDTKKEFSRSEEKKHKLFAITLQRFESRLFVDNFYNKLKRDGFWVLTKHDSLIVKRSAAKEVLTTLDEFVKTINFNCTFRSDLDQVIEVPSHNIESEIKTNTAKLMNDKPQLYCNPYLKGNKVETIEQKKNILFNEFRKNNCLSLWDKSAKEIREEFEKYYLTLNREHDGK